MIEIKNLSKTFKQKGGDVDAVQDVSLTVEDGEIYGVIGYSGAGKSTLVRCLNLLEIPDGGSLRVGDSPEMTFENGRAYIADKGGKRPMSRKEQNALRRGVGMIFQHFNLLDRSTVFENVAYPLRYSGMKKDAIRARVLEMLELVGLTEKKDVYPSQLSGGQKQRVAIARALASNPKILLSDEATSALDPDATAAILNLLRELNEKLHLTIVLITHEMAVIKTICRRVAVMEDGRVVEEGDVYDVFANPQTPIAKRFVASASALSKVDTLVESKSQLVQTKPGEKLIRLTFGNDCVGDHLITTVARNYNVDLNIVLANVEILQDSTLGGLVAILSGKEEDVAAALAYLNENHVGTEVLN